MGLSDAYALQAKPEIEKMMRSLAAGIMLMQIQDASSPVNGAFLSWQNLWHGYGNSQAYALLEAGSRLGDRDMIKAAFKELDHFHPWLIKNGLANAFTVQQQGEKVTLIEEHKFSQIAYIIRPMVFANIKAWEISRDTVYLQQAVDLTLWFFKKNPAQAQMYYPVTGIAFDGIDSAAKVNKNSGAESTIEALLTLQLMESIPEAKRMLDAVIEKRDIER
ncbi:MAG: sugar phosphotransferase [Chania sp.]